MKGRGEPLYADDNLIGHAVQLERSIRRKRQVVWGLLHMVGQDRRRRALLYRLRAAWRAEQEMVA